MRRHAVIPATALAAAAGLVAGPLGVARAGASTAWIGTATQAVPVTTGLSYGAPMDPSTPMRIQVVLDLRDSSTLDRYIAAGDTMTAAAFERQFAPTAAQVSQVESYLRSQGLDPSSVTPNEVIVTATGPASAVESAFDTSLAEATTPDGSGFANSTPAQVPTSLGGVVGAVLGLNDVYSVLPATLQTVPLPLRHLMTTGDPARQCGVNGLPYDCEYTPKGLRRHDRSDGRQDHHRRLRRG